MSIFWQKVGILDAFWPKLWLFVWVGQSQMYLNAPEFWFRVFWFHWCWFMRSKLISHTNLTTGKEAAIARVIQSSMQRSTSQMERIQIMKLFIASVAAQHWFTTKTGWSIQICLAKRPLFLGEIAHYFCLLFGKKLEGLVLSGRSYVVKSGFVKVKSI
jgi:hypothetical protein